MDWLFFSISRDNTIEQFEQKKKNCFVRHISSVEKAS